MEKSAEAIVADLGETRDRKSDDDTCRDKERDAIDRVMHLHISFGKPLANQHQQTGYLATEFLDAKLIRPDAVKVLQIAADEEA